MTNMAITFSGYGKLPLSREYVKVHCQDSLAGHLMTLIDQGAANILKALTPPAPLDVFYSPAPGKPMVAARIWPSADAGGLREFPFAVFATLPGVQAEKNNPAALAALQPLFPCMDQVFANSGQVGTTAELSDHFVGNIDSSQLPTSHESVCEAFTQAAGAIRLDTYADQLFSGQRDRLILLLWSLKGIGAQAVAAKKRFLVGCKLPLTPAHPDLLQSAIWISLLAKVLPGLPWPLDLIIQRWEGGAGLFVFFRRLTPLELSILPPRARVPGFFDLTTPAEPASLTGFTAFADHCEQQMSSGFTLDRFAEIFEEFNP